MNTMTFVAAGDHPFGLPALFATSGKNLGMIWAREGSSVLFHANGTDLANVGQAFEYLLNTVLFQSSHSIRAGLLPNVYHVAFYLD